MILVDEDGQIRQRELPNLAIRHVYKQPGRGKNNLPKTKLRPGWFGSAFFMRFLGHRDALGITTLEMAEKIHFLYTKTAGLVVI